MTEQSPEWLRTLKEIVETGKARVICASQRAEPPRLATAKAYALPLSEAQHEALRLALWHLDAANVEKLTLELAEARAALDPPICRLQFPDGSVPGNIRECAEGWKRLADEARAELAEARAACAEVKEG